MIVLPVRRRFEKLAVVKIERRLPTPGKILVKVGESVTPSDTLGRAEVSGGFRKINLSSILGLSSSQVESSLTKKLGETVYKGEPLAKKTGLLGISRKVLVSPVDGVIEAISDGEVTIRFSPTTFELLAGFGGVVESVQDDEAATIAAVATKLRGVVGFGGSRFGNLEILGRTNEFLLPQHLDSNAAGKIVVGGAIVGADTIEKALAIGVKGIVTGGINFHETLGWTEGSDIGLSIVAMEGYGFHTIGEDIFDKIKGLDGEYAAISGSTATLLVAEAGSTKGHQEKPWREPKVGDKVRVVAGADQGRMGEVKEISSRRELFPSGLKSQAVTFKDKEDLVVPWQNLEIIVD